MWDPNFKRTVILLCEHNEEGSFGLVVNRQMDYKIGDAIPDLDFVDAPLFYGGPVEPETLHFLHRYGDIIDNCVKVSEDLYWGGNFEQIKTYFNTRQINPAHIRFYIGYSGWEASQLAGEIKQNSWMVAQSKANYIFAEQSEQLWRSVLQDMGGEFRVISHFPENPQYN